MATKLEERWSGHWVGEGVIVGCGPLRWLMPREPFAISTQFQPLTESISRIRDRLEFTRGGTMDRTMFIERTGEGCYHATADDMPLGADIFVSEESYRYTPYYSWACLRGRRCFARVVEEGRFLTDGSIEADILIRWRGIPIARNRLVLRRAEGEAPGAMMHRR